MSKVTIPGLEDKDRYDDYTELLVQKDQLQKEALSYQIAYTQEFGELICANFELKIQCIKVKKSISYCRRRLNRGLAVDPVKMDEEIEREMKAYYLQRDELQADYAQAKKAGMTDGITYMRAKKIYRRLAKLLHPDINGKTEQDAELSDLWNRIVAAYMRNDAQKLEELEVLAKHRLEELGADSFEKDYSNLEERIEEVEREIDIIISTEPYTYKEILEDEEKIKELRNTLQAEHDDFEQYLATLKQALEEMMKEEASKVIWLTN
ncbi:MAG: hypothetical protein J5757_10500 [Lachnospiraceae bacterium]|nr:hypothetical protein [Lachnospiraceae bacterium]